MLSVSACSSLNDSKVGVKPYPLSEKEESLLEAFNLLNQSQLLSFNAPKDATSVMIHVYSLDEHGNGKTFNQGWPLD